MTSRKIGAGSLAGLMGGWQSGAAGLPTYRRIQQALRLLILDGRLPLGMKLPGERHLAGQLGVSRTTIAAAYAELREQGFAASLHGSGTVTRLPGERDKRYARNYSESQDTEALRDYVKKLMKTYKKHLMRW